MEGTMRSLRLLPLTRFIIPVILGLGLLLSFAFTLFMSGSASAVTAADWNPGRIIDDQIFYNKDAMSVFQIQAFLNAKVPNCDRWRSSSNPSYQPPYTCLFEYQEVIETGESNYGRFNQDGTPLQIPGARSAAQIIWEAAQEYSINPQVLIVMLQKEQSLVTDDWPWLIQYQKAMGQSCPDTAPCDPAFAGFYNQVSGAAWQIRHYYNHPDWFNYRAETTRFVQWNPNGGCGGTNVYIQNNATAALYNYTPYQPNAAALNNMYGTGDGCSSYGNRNFWRLFNDWFGTTYTISNADIANGVYRLITTDTDKSVDVYGAGTQNGTKVQLWSNNPSGAQTWQVTRLDDGYYTFQNVQSGKYLDVEGANAANNTAVQIWQGTGSCAQKWAIVKHGDNFAILSSCSGRSLTNSNIKQNGASMYMYTFIGADTQQWRLVDISNASGISGVYRLTVSTGKSLDIVSKSFGTSTTMQIASQNSSSSQYWYVQSTPEGYYTLKNVSAGTYLSVFGAGTSNGTDAHTWSTINSCSQKWAIVDNDTGYHLISACSGRALDVWGDNTNIDGTKVQIWDKNVAGAQRWLFTTIEPIVENGLYSISVASGKLLDVYGASSANGTKVQIWSNNSNDAQKWQLENTVDGYVTLRNPSSGKYLDVEGAGTGNSTRVQIWQNTGSCAQRWLITPNEAGYNLVSACSGRALDVWGGNTNTDGTKVQIWDKNDTSAQRWQLISI